MTGTMSEFSGKTKHAVLLHATKHVSPLADLGRFVAALATSRVLPVLTVFLFAFLAGCTDSPLGLATVKMEIGRKTFTLEIADTNASQEHGLMERDSMPADHGMIFVFADEKERSFWMKNTRFPLDIVFTDATGKVVSIHQMKAYDQNTTSSDYPAKYAIELNLNAAKDADVHPGDKLTIPKEAREPKSEK